MHLLAPLKASSAIVTHQIGNGNKKIIENTFAEERLDEPAAGTTVVAADVEGLEDSHGRHDGVE